MTNEEMRIKIAEACGWQPDKRGLGWLSSHGCYDPLPDYLNDLNAMHEAEKVLTNKQWWLFVEFLTEIRGGGVALCISATPLQRAEAFLIGGRFAG